MSTGRPTGEERWDSLGVDASSFAPIPDLEERVVGQLRGIRQDWGEDNIALANQYFSFFCQMQDQSVRDYCPASTDSTTLQDFMEDIEHEINASYEYLRSVHPPRSPPSLVKGILLYILPAVLVLDGVVKYMKGDVHLSSLGCCAIPVVGIVALVAYATRNRKPSTKEVSLAANGYVKIINDYIGNQPE